MFLACLLAGSLLSPASLLAGGVTLITHGWNPNNSAPAWMSSLRDAVASNYLAGAQNFGTITVTKPAGSLVATCSPWNVDLSAGSNGEIVILLDWSAVANHLTGGPAAQAVAAAVIDKLVSSQNGQRPLAELPLHLVGHSRGGGMVCELARLLGERGIVVDQLTPLDPHPLTASDPQPIYPLSAVIDTPAAIYQNVVFADAYSQTNEYPMGQYLTGGYNRLWGPMPGGYYNNASPDNVYACHRNILLMYQATADLGNPLNNGEATLGATERAAWFNTYEAAGDKTGFTYSRLDGAGNWAGTTTPVASGDAIRAGFNNATVFGGAGARASLAWSAAVWPNVATLDVLTNGTPLASGTHDITPGTSLQLRYVYLDYDSGCTITLRADADRNPYNGNDVSVVSTQVVAAATGGTFAQNTVTWDTTGMAGGTTVYLYAQATDGTRTRFLSAPAAVRFIALPSPAVTITNTVTSVPASQTTLVLGGTNNAYVTGTMRYTNTANAASGTFAAQPAWTTPAIALAYGPNVLTVSGTNSSGVSASDSITVTRESPVAPSVTTDPVTDITVNSAQGGGNVTSAGSSPVTAHGLCWNTTGSPTVSDSKTEDATTPFTGAFTATMAGLASSQTYYVRAYATSAAGTGYGAERTFTTATPPMAPPGNALAFDGTNDYVNVGHGAGLNVGNTVTIEAWIKPATLAGRQGIFSTRLNNAGGSFQLEVGSGSSGTNRLAVTGVSTWVAQTGDNALTANQWTHIAYTRTGTGSNTHALYINGVAQPLISDANYTFTNNASDKVIGSGTSGAQLFSGQIDELRVWNVARTETQIRDAMHRQLSGSETGLAAYYQFNQGAGTTLPDLTANANTGTLINGPTWVASTIPCANAIAGRVNVRGAWNARPDSLASGRFSLAKAAATDTNFAVFGHDNAADGWQTADLPSGMLARLTRVWQAELSGNVSADVRFDLGGLGGIADPADLRLLVDADGTFAGGATVLAGVYSASTFTVAARSLTNGAFYTLALARVVPLVPQRVADIQPGSVSSGPSQLTLLNGMLYFSADDGSHGDELWKSDGTTAGTTIAKDIYPGKYGSSLRELMSWNGLLFMSAYDGTHGEELWKSDGTESGTALVKDIYTGTLMRWPHALTGMGDRLYFVHEDATYGDELRKTDGSEANTVLVKDATPGTNSSRFTSAVAVGNLLFLAGDNVPNQWELWRSDGTEAGTYRTRDINTNGSASVGSLAAFGGVVLFSANDGVTGSELWRSDGSSNGTYLVKDINPGAASGSPSGLANIAGTIFFSAADGTNGTALWKTDGTEAGTVLIKNINPGKRTSGISQLTEFKGQAFFQANDGTHGTELWRSDGTAAGTVMVKDIYTASSSNADPQALTVVGDYLFFVANVGPGSANDPTGRSSLYQLWRTDGTEAGTVLVMDDIKVSGSNGELRAAGRSLYLAADGGDGAGIELWRIPTGGAPGDCLAFNGTTQSVDLGANNAFALTNGAFTLEAWILPNSSKSNICTIVGRKSGGGSSPGYAFYYNNWQTRDGRLVFETQNQKRQTVDPVLTWSAWQHVAATWDGTTLRLYVNGLERPSTGGVALTNGAVHATLGAFPGAIYGLDGQMDEVRLWTVTRTEADLRDAMHQELTGGETGLLAYYRFNQDLGTTATDQTANHLDGTLVNGPVWTASTLPCADTIAGWANLRGAWLGQSSSLASSILSVSNAVVNGTDFRVFGHNAAALAKNTTDKPAGILWRLDRAWQAEGAGALTGDVRFDCSGLTSLIGNPANLRLLVDSDGTFANATAIAGTYTSGVFHVDAEALADGAFYTLGESSAAWTLTASAGAHGAIAPSGAVSVANGAAANFTITPAAYYHVANVTTNGVSVGAVTSFSWDNVTADGTITATFAPDLSASGTPHWWLAQHGWTNDFDAAEASDADGDGHTAAREYQADTNPTNAASCLHITSVGTPPLTVQFWSSSNRVYSLCYATNLTDAPWTVLPGRSNLLGTGAVMSLDDTNRAAVFRVYRVKVSLP